MRKPNYNKIYIDLLDAKFPEKLKKFKSILDRKKQLSVLDVIKLNEDLFGVSYKERQKYRSYDKPAILEILGYQKKNRLNNSQVATHFRISRNTVAAWKKKFII
jgi:hypothetical protein